MDSFAIAIVSVLLAAVAFLLVRLHAQRKLLAHFMEELRAAEDEWGVEEVDPSQFIEPRPNPFITIEILNAVEMATKASIVGGLIGKCAPDLMHKMVVKRTADTMRNQMTEHGVQVVVKVHSPD